MRNSAGPWLFRRWSRALSGLVILAALVSGSASAEEASFPPVEAIDVTLTDGRAVPPPPAPPTGQLVPSAQFVEDPTRQAGGEDDAQRAYDRQQERQQEQNDDGDRRRK